MSDVHAQRMQKEPCYRELFFSLKRVKETGLALDELKELENHLYQELGAVLLRFVTKKTSKKCDLSLWEIDDLRMAVLEDFYRILQRGPFMGKHRLDEILDHPEELWMACIENTFKHRRSTFFREQSKVNEKCCLISKENDDLSDIVRGHKESVENDNATYSLVESDIWVEEVLQDDVVSFEIWLLYYNHYQNLSFLYKHLVEGDVSTLADETKEFIAYLRTLSKNYGKEQLRKFVSGIRFKLKDTYEKTVV